MSGASAPLLALSGVALDGAAEWVEAGDGVRLRAALFRAYGEPRGSVVLSPGRTEPIEKYAETLADLQRRGFAVLIHDWRGQGLSGGVAAGWARRPRRGHARGWRPLLADHARLLDVFSARLPRPWIGLGHSMGGGLLLLALAEGETRIDGAILSAPMLGLRLGGRPPWLVGSAAAVMTFIGRGGDATPPVGGRNRGAVGDGETLTHDPQRWAQFEALLRRWPELAVGAPTWGWLQMALLVIRRLAVLPGLAHVEAPVTIVGAEHDQLVTTASQRLAASRLPNGRYLEVEDAFHELLMESDARRAVFWRAFDELAKRVGA